ncbi:MAG: serine/threonine dehydratase [Gemmatales bacterium]|nr:MAG: serine/threonine dehydratase [Gemmatales bacterium]
MSGYAANLADIYQAAARIAPYSHKTPVMTCATLDRLSGKKLYFKCELFQKTGSFKFRGACNAVMQLPEDVARRGVVTHSSGNHAQALALAAKERGIRAYVVMPTTASPVKANAVREYGGEVIECAPTLKARETVAQTVLDETKGTLIPPYDDPRVIAGQGTIALELLESLPELDAIVSPIGGGGLVSGVALAAKEAKPTLKVFGIEPKGADDAARSKSTGRLIPQTSPNTIADGLLTSLGEFTWPVVRDLVAEILTVSDEEIVSAMRLLWERAKLLVEPSGAVSLAGVLSERFRSFDSLRHVAVILSGGNVNLATLPF